jgi:hypothetical protein
MRESQQQTREEPEVIDVETLVETIDEGIRAESDGLSVDAEEGQAEAVQVQEGIQRRP